MREKTRSSNSWGSTTCLRSTFWDGYRAEFFTVGRAQHAPFAGPLLRRSPEIERGGNLESTEKEEIISMGSSVGAFRGVKERIEQGQKGF